MKYYYNYNKIVIQSSAINKISRGLVVCKNLQKRAITMHSGLL